LYRCAGQSAEPIQSPDYNPTDLSCQDSFPQSLPFRSVIVGASPLVAEYTHFLPFPFQQGLVVHQVGLLAFRFLAVARHSHVDGGEHSQPLKWMTWIRQ